MPPSAATRELLERVRALCRPDLWPDHPLSVRALETHFSWVFLTRTMAFKLKKPNHFAGWDLRSAQARYESARTEVALNRRLAPEVYLGVLPVVRGPNGIQLGGHGPIVDWLVWMRRLPDEGMLAHALRSGRVTPGELRPPARALASFWRRQPPLGRTPAQHVLALRRVLHVNRRVLAQSPDLPRGRVHGLLDELDAWLRHHARSVGARARFVVEGHGDLRPEHVFLGAPPAIIDCLEFDRSIRLLDPVDEIAFLGAASDAIAPSPVRAVFLDAWREASGDDPPLELLAFYGALRCAVRARLAVRRAREPGEDHGHALRSAGAWLRTAERQVHLLGEVA